MFTRARETGGLYPVNLTGRHGWIRPIVLILLQAIMAVELWFLVGLAAWMHAGLVSSLMIIVALSELARRRLAFAIPVEFQIAGILFMFAAIFLGEVRGYYERIWWWDLALHGSAGLMLGTIGFLLVYFLNESRTIQLHMRPAFVAFFAFCFAMTIGVLWEVFEFSMDRLFGLQMQKPMFGDPSGLTDTMWDLIVDGIGALLVCLWGWHHLARGKGWLVDRWIAEFSARGTMSEKA